MKKMTSRRGSALLVVLGLLAFMIVSAIAFSAYMRASRLPASYLRRMSASRQLVKAALARAIDEIDLAVNDNYYPGLGDKETVVTRERDSSQTRYQNVWKNRVYFGTNGFVQLENNLPTTTAPVLSLEGLAYIPPALINDARYYSRLSPAAEWKAFDFDAGRYAFCALDVSDYFDVNRMMASLARSSADQSRVSLGYLFENDTHTSEESGMTEWDDWLVNYRTEEGTDPALALTYKDKIPLVSLADFNLSYGDKTLGGLISPFFNYLGGGFNLNDMGSDSEMRRIRRMTFVTDGYYPDTRTDEEKADEYGYSDPYSLAGDGQPFPKRMLDGSNKNSGDDILKLGSKGALRLIDSLSVLGLMTLCDYLDADDCPISLAIPAVERGPMLCGLKPNFTGAKLSIKTVNVPADVSKVLLSEDADDGAAVDNSTGPAAGASSERQVYCTKKYWLQELFSMGGPLANGLDATFMYPFARKHLSGTEPTFEASGRVAFFFTDKNEQMKLRTSVSDADELRWTKDFMNQKGALTSGLISIPFNPPLPSFNPTTFKKQEDAIKKVTAPLTESLSDVQDSVNNPNNPFLRVTYKWTQNWTVDSNTGIGSWSPVRSSVDEPPPDAKIVKVECAIPPLKGTGETDTGFMDRLKEDDFTETELTLHVSIGMRVENKTKNLTVDLVPASHLDDKEFNDVDHGAIANEAVMKLTSGESRPLMRFDTGIKLKVTKTSLALASGTGDLTISPSAVRVDDPRFNYAPESWYGCTDIEPSEWKTLAASNGRDGDIFMAVSNQGYLQSIYELAFLPRLTGDSFAEGTVPAAYKNISEVDFTSFKTSGSDALNYNLMWKTYRLFGSGRDDFEGCGFVSDSGKGVKVNPYTDSTNVMMAAFANTPLSWAYASTNMVSSSSSSTPAEPLAWNEFDNEDKFLWKDLEGIAGAFMNEICQNRQSVMAGNNPQIQELKGELVTNDGNEPWQNAWDNLWDSLDFDDEKRLTKIGNYELVTDPAETPLWSVDRKFLYGYWRECFAARQQLYLIFVRAEPLMMGGGSLNKVPPQLGGRAVALVWRDPRPTNVALKGDDAAGVSRSGMGYPHRTRLLFYKPLE